MVQVGLVSTNPQGILDQDYVRYCTVKLPDKAEHFKCTGIVPTLDSTYGVAKSDVLVADGLRDALRRGFLQLESEKSSSATQEPEKTGLRDIVDPSMYPLIFGHSLVVDDAVFGVADAIDKWAGTGETIPGHLYTDEAGDEDEKVYWSKTYQWLPANVKFADDGRVCFTSYINNLHLNKHRHMYETIEKLVQLPLLPLWDQCVARHIFSLHSICLHGAGRRDRRIRAYSVE